MDVARPLEPCVVLSNGSVWTPKFFLLRQKVGTLNSIRAQKRPGSGPLRFVKWFQHIKVQMFAELFLEDHAFDELITLITSSPSDR